MVAAETPKEGPPKEGRTVTDPERQQLVLVLHQGGMQVQADRTLLMFEPPGHFQN